jgi:hypothetical protein
LNAASLLFAKETCKQLYQPLVIKRKLSDNELISLVNIELHGAVVTHLQQERLAIVLMLYVHALHDFGILQRLFAKGNQNLVSISHWGSLYRHRSLIRPDQMSI